MQNQTKQMGKCEYLEKKKQSVETVSEGLQMLDLVDKDFKAAIINSSKTLVNHILKIKL